MSLLELSGVGKRYGAVAAVADVTFEAAAASRTAIVGPSGSGKTTLLRLIAGFEAPDEGRIIIDGRIVADGAHTVPAHRRGVGYVPQDGALFPHLTAAENIGFGLPRAAPDRNRRIAELADMVELDATMTKRKPDELSGGQQQRVALARALAQKPRLMLLDEPFSALDTGLRAATRKAVARLLNQAGVATILVTHDQAEALSFADQVAVMRGGRLSQIGSPRQLYWRPRDAMIAEFMGEAILLPARIEGGVAECALGTIPAPSDAAPGEAQIMLRPEQVSAIVVSPRDDPGGPLGEVTDIDFSGAVCALTVRLRVGGLAPVTVRVSGLDIPSRGATVRIVILGAAHVFPRTAGGGTERGC